MLRRAPNAGAPTPRWPTASNATDSIRFSTVGWHSRSSPASPPRRSAGEERGHNTVDGLAASLRLAGTGTQEPLWPRLGALDMPVLVVAGGDDTKFSAEAERLTASIGANATMTLVPGAGHTAHLERPEEFLATLRPWLAERGL